MATPPGASSRPFSIMPSLKTTGKTICILPRYQGLGGPASFSARLKAALEEQGIQVGHDPLAPGVGAILVIGGTRRLDILWRARQRGARIVQRLNGMNWVHRKLPTGLRHYLKAEASNWILSTIRRRLAESIIYQSNFTREWWNRAYGPVKAPSRVIFNGVNLADFSPKGPERPPADRFRILMVEGHLGGGMETGLENAARLAQQLRREGPGTWELVVAGDVPGEIRQRWAERAPELISWAGVVPRDQIPALDRAAHMLFSADLNAACPNSVIEALACGLPVIAFGTGALPEMVTAGSGITVPYGSNYWNLEPPVIAPLVEAARQIAAGQASFRKAARARAEASFDIRQVMAAYLEVLG
jgi:glycosyltransferase involved in cell wall biosynthesis